MQIPFDLVASLDVVPVIAIERASDAKASLQNAIESGAAQALEARK